MNKNEFKIKFTKLAERIGISFNSIDYFYEAFTHPSYANENNCRHYERLEFLGDSVLGFLVSEFLFKTFEMTEGEMTKTRANFVCTQANAEYSQALGLDSCLLLGKGAKEHNEDSIAVMADLFESFLGALYLDQGLDYVRDFLSIFLFPRFINQKVDFITDYKGRLQEYIQAESRQGVSYVLISESGPPHNKTFEVAVYHDGVKLGEGKGKTKKEAEQNAAKEALKIVVR